MSKIDEGLDLIELALQIAKLYKGELPILTKAIEIAEKGVRYARLAKDLDASAADDTKQWADELRTLVDEGGITEEALDNQLSRMEARNAELQGEAERLRAQKSS